MLRWVGGGVAAVLGIGAVLGFQNFMREATKPPYRDPITLARYDAWDEANNEPGVINAAPFLAQSYLEADAKLRGYGYELVASSEDADKHGVVSAEGGRVYYSISWRADGYYGCGMQTTVALSLDRNSKVVSAQAYQEPDFLICY